MKKIAAVYVRHPKIKHIRYLCSYTPHGWKCGKCGRGNLGHHRAYNYECKDECKVCHAVVLRVIWDEDRPPFVARREPLQIPDYKVKELQLLLSKLGLVLTKSTNNSYNVGKAPEYVLLEALANGT
jgi:hypothetical protein